MQSKQNPYKDDLAPLFKTDDLKTFKALVKECVTIKLLVEVDGCIEVEKPVDPKEKAKPETKEKRVELKEEKAKSETKEKRVELTAGTNMLHFMRINQLVTNSLDFMNERGIGYNGKRIWPNWEAQKQGLLDGYYARSPESAVVQTPADACQSGLRRALSIVDNHDFVNGNFRTAQLVALVHILKVGYVLSMEEGQPTGLELAARYDAWYHGFMLAVHGAKEPTGCDLKTIHQNNNYNGSYVKSDCFGKAANALAGMCKRAQGTKAKQEQFLGFVEFFAKNTESARREYFDSHKNEWMKWAMKGYTDTAIEAASSKEEKKEVSSLPEIWTRFCVVADVNPKTITKSKDKAFEQLRMYFYPRQLKYEFDNNNLPILTKDMEELINKRFQEKKPH